MLDLAGLRSWDLPAAIVKAVSERHPRGSLVLGITQAVRNEASAVPDGRFALTARWGFLLAIRAAPASQLEDPTHFQFAPCDYHQDVSDRRA